MTDLDRDMPREGDFVSDAEIARRWGLGISTARVAIQKLEHQGFPRKDPLFGNKRFWPAVRAYMLKRAGCSAGMAPAAHDGEDHWEHDKAYNSRRAGSSVASKS